MNLSFRSFIHTLSSVYPQLIVDLSFLQDLYGIAQTFVLIHIGPYFFHIREL